MAYWGRLFSSPLILHRPTLFHFFLLQAYLFLSFLPPPPFREGQGSSRCLDAGTEVWRREEADSDCHQGLRVHFVMPVLEWRKTVHWNTESLPQCVCGTCLNGQARRSGNGGQGTREPSRTPNIDKPAHPPPPPHPQRGYGPMCNMPVLSECRYMYHVSQNGFRCVPRSIVLHSLYYAQGLILCFQRDPKPNPNPNDMT